jgi:hypothetical protein
MVMAVLGSSGTPPSGPSCAKSRAPGIAVNKVTLNAKKREQNLNCIKEARIIAENYYFFHVFTSHGGYPDS